MRTNIGEWVPVFTAHEMNTRSERRAAIVECIGVFRYRTIADRLPVASTAGRPFYQRVSE